MTKSHFYGKMVNLINRQLCRHKQIPWRVNKMETRTIKLEAAERIWPYLSDEDKVILAEQLGCEDLELEIDVHNALKSIVETLNQINAENDLVLSDDFDIDEMPVVVETDEKDGAFTWLKKGCSAKKEEEEEIEELHVPPWLVALYDLPH